MAEFRIPAPPLRGPELPASWLSPTAIHFTTRAAYHAWARAVDAEAPGLARQLVTISRPNGGYDVLLQLKNSDADLTADGTVHTARPRPAGAAAANAHLNENPVQQ